MRRRQVLALLASPAFAGCAFGSQQSPPSNEQPTTQERSSSSQESTPTETGRPTETSQADPTTEALPNEISSQTPPTETPSPTPTLTVTRRYAFGEYHRAENPLGLGGTLEFTVTGFELRTPLQSPATETTTPTPGNEQVLTATAKVRNPLDRGYQDVCPRDPSLFAAIVDGTTYQNMPYDYSCFTSSHGLLLKPGETQTLNVRTDVSTSVNQADIEIGFDGNPDDTKLYPIRWA